MALGALGVPYKWFSHRTAGRSTRHGVSSLKVALDCQGMSQDDLQLGGPRCMIYPGSGLILSVTISLPSYLGDWVSVLDY